MSYHKCKRLQNFASRHNDIVLKYIPPYSPEYNPVEQVWKWAKKAISIRRIPFSNIEEVVKEFRKLIWHKRNRPDYNELNIGIGKWKNLFVNI